ncbi:hypothetical protein PGB90_006499 [Kerria lacca]
MYSDDETFTFKTRRKWIPILLIWTILQGQLASSTPIILCPEFCECSVNNNGLQVATCTELLSNGTSFPNIHVLTLKPSDVGVDCYIPEDISEIFPQLNYLELQNCSLTYIPSNSFRELKSLEEIDLSNNFLRKFSQSIFASNNKLRYVNLCNNPLNITARPLLTSNSIWELDLSYCNISKIVPNTFKNLPNLKYLTLSNNKIESIKDNTLPNGLKMINLQHNNITNIPIGELNRLKRLRQLDFSENPVNCTCELITFQSWLSGKAIVFSNSVKCANPKEYFGRTLVSLPQYEMCDAKIERESNMEPCKPGQICSNQIVFDDGYVMDQPNDFDEFIKVPKSKMPNKDLFDVEEGSGKDEVQLYTDSDLIAKTEIPNDRYTIISKNFTEENSSKELLNNTTEEIFQDELKTTKYSQELQKSEVTKSPTEENKLQKPEDEPNTDQLIISNNDKEVKNPVLGNQIRNSKFSARYMIPSLLVLAVILICFSVYFSHHNCRVKGWSSNDPKTNNTTEMHDVNLLPSDSLVQNSNKYSNKYPAEGETGQTEKLMDDTESSEEPTVRCTTPNGHSTTISEPVQSVYARVTSNPDSVPKTPTIIRKD